MTINTTDVAMKVIILFLTMLCGVYARKAKILDWKSTKSLSGFLANITNPLLIVMSFQKEFTKELLTTGFQVLIGSAISHIAFAAIAYIIFRRTKNAGERSVYEFATIFANCGFLGYPVLMAIFGEIGLFYGVFYTTFFNFFVWTYGVFLLARSKKEQSIDFKKIFFNAGTIATFIGFVLFIFSISVPSPISDAAIMVGDMTFPLSMIIIGSLIADIDFKSLIKNAYLYIITAIRLIIFPLITLGICILLKLPPVLTYVLVIMSGMPVATLVAIIAELYEVETSLAAKCVGVTSILSIATIPLITYILSLIIPL